MSRHDMLVRDFMPGDETELRRVFLSSVHGLAAAFYSKQQLDAWAPASCEPGEWAGRIIALRPFVVVADARIAAYADLQSSGHIDHFFVAAESSGRGIGSALMQHLHGVAADRGVTRLSAHVSLSAEAFFARHGFAVDQRRTVVVRGVRLANAKMSKALPAAVPVRPDRPRAW